jgi:hypothetical protein
MWLQYEVFVLSQKDCPIMSMAVIALALLALIPTGYAYSQEFSICN